LIANLFRHIAPCSHDNKSAADFSGRCRLDANRNDRSAGDLSLFSICLAFLLSGPCPPSDGGANFTASAPGAENPSYATASLAELRRGKLDTLLDNRMLRDAPAPAAAAAAAAVAVGGVG